MKIGEDAYFYPSHLSKGLLATGVAIVAGVSTVGAAGYALREFSLIGTEQYPQTPPPKPKPPLEKG